MTDSEFELIDQLYFVTHFNDLLDGIDMDREEMLTTLQSVLNRGWVKAYQDREASQEIGNPDESLDAYYFLASKKGLFAHNSV